MTSPRRLAIWVIALSLGVSASASAQTATAKEHLERGLRYFNTQEYAQAIAEFKAGYQLDPNPDFLYALAQAQRLAGNCRDASQAYLAFLRTHPPEKQAELARGNLAKCEQDLAREPPPATPAAPPPKPEVAPVPAPTIAIPPPAELPTSPFYTDWFGDALVGLGVAGLGVGAGLWIAAAGHAASANEARTYEDYAADGESAKELRTAALVAGGIGAALVVGGIVRWATLSVAPATTGGRIAFAGRF